MKKTTLSILICVVTFVHSQAQYNDAQLWSAVSLDKRITKKLTGAIEQQVRLSHNISFPKNIFTEVGAGYRFNKMIKYSVYYRFINRGQTEGGFVLGNRIAGDLRVRYKVKPIVISYRNRLQREYRVDAPTEAPVGGELVYRQINYIRNKLSLAIDLDKKFTPYLAFETYYHLNEKEFNKNRYTAGVNFNLKNRNELDVFYRVQDEYNVNNPVRGFVFGIGFSHSMKGRLIKKKKKKKEPTPTS
ncbi:MAG: DUF2490 domain-containing protein [Flavobacteriales bacterium]|nr:DUF2490 domain-containing protein [Flavobacteriales bacterium]